MAGGRDGKKGSGDSGSKKKIGKAFTLGMPIETSGEPVEDAPVDLTEQATVELTDEAPFDTREAAPRDTAPDVPEDNYRQYPADEPIEAPPAIAAEASAPEPDPEAADATLDLSGVEERLPWLESDDDFDKDDNGGGRIAGFMIGGLLALALIVGGIWWVAHREKPEEIADGGVIEAPAVAYKEAPKNPGGKTFAGTGDTSFTVSEGQSRPARLGEATPAAKPSAAAPPKPAASGSAEQKPATAEPEGVGVQVAAFTSRSTAEAGWTKLVGQHEALKGVSHRIVEGRADIGTVYRLQAVAGDVAAANALCAKLKASGGACQVKR